MKSFLEEAIQGFVPPKPKISVKRLTENELPSNIRPETPQDLVSYSIRDLKSTVDGLRSHLTDMQRSRADERQILALEQEIDILGGAIQRLERAMSLIKKPTLDDPELRKQWTQQYGESVVLETKERKALLKQRIDNGEIPEVTPAGFSSNEDSLGDLEDIGYAKEHTEPSHYGRMMMSSWYEYTGPGKVRVVSKGWMKPYILTANPSGPNERNSTPPVEWDVS